MELRQLRQFLAVAGTSSFRKAAEQLHMAQPPLSVSIKRLEDELGAHLFVRSRRGVKLSATGDLLREDAQRAVFHADQFLKSAATAATGVRGGLKVGFVGSATYSLLPSLLPGFRAAFPGISLELLEGTTREILASVERGDLDAGLVRYPVVESFDVQMTVVEPDVLVAALPASSRFARRKRLQLRDLSSQDFILYSASVAPSLRAQVMLACQAAGFTPRVVQEAVQIQTVVSLVESGLGVALVPSACQAHAVRKVAFAPLTDVPAFLNVAIAAVSRPRASSQAAAHFIRFIEDTLAADKRATAAVQATVDRLAPIRPATRSTASASSIAPRAQLEEKRVVAAAGHEQP